jgi:hypothetical protein
LGDLEHFSDDFVVRVLGDDALVIEPDPCRAFFGVGLQTAIPSYFTRRTAPLPTAVSTSRRLGGRESASQPAFTPG